MHGVLCAFMHFIAISDNSLIAASATFASKEVNISNFDYLIFFHG